MRSTSGSRMAGFDLDMPGSYHKTGMAFGLNGERRKVVETNAGIVPRLMNKKGTRMGLNETSETQFLAAEGTHHDVDDGRSRAGLSRSGRTARLAGARLATLIGFHRRGVSEGPRN